jgi:uncharacterized membrane protein
MANLFTRFASHFHKIIGGLFSFVIVFIIVFLSMLLKFAAWTIDFWFSAAPPHGAAPL